MINRNYILNVADMVEETGDNDLDKLLIAIKIFRDLGIRPNGFQRFTGDPDRASVQPNTFNRLMDTANCLPDTDIGFFLDRLSIWNPEPRDYQQLTTAIEDRSYHV